MEDAVCCNANSTLVITHIKYMQFGTQQFPCQQGDDIGIVIYRWLKPMHDIPLYSLNRQWWIAYLGAK
jgi:hypothetical protein